MEKSKRRNPSPHNRHLLLPPATATATATATAGASCLLPVNGLPPTSRRLATVSRFFSLPSRHRCSSLHVLLRRAFPSLDNAFRVALPQFHGSSHGRCLYIVKKVEGYKKQSRTGKKKIERPSSCNLMNTAQGNQFQAEEIQAELEGRNILEIDHPEGPFGTKILPCLNIEETLSFMRSEEAASCDINSAQGVNGNNGETLRL
ncbi:hypothetical protein PIB30_091062 [Stylosanthes scabra]|uniref:Uncharacterized protein n=1 Tax=Stylosanthes scabra TaxID=79078 RepID=A0ABU6QTX0_9FABA|nr:hypothetical protein [Stylosanthes scabra]